MTLLKNDPELTRFFCDKIKEASEYIADKLIEINKDSIQEVVYDIYSPTEYQRNPEATSFKNAWDKKISTSEQTVETEVFYAPDRMALHESVLTGQDVRPYLVNIIYQGLAGHIFGVGAWTEPRDAFARLEQKLQSGANSLDKIVKQGLKNAGLKIIK